MNICRICLRTDRKVNAVHHELVEFHDELCEYSLSTYNPQYCTECEYLLKKTYNFKLKCETAVKIFNKWKSNKNSKQQPVELLYTVLPPSSLGVWSQSNNRVFIYREDGADSEPQTINPMKNIIKNDQDINYRLEQKKKPVELLYTVLPPSSIELWTHSNNKVYTYREDEPTSCVNGEDPEPQTTDPMKTIIKNDQDRNDRQEQIFNDSADLNESTEQEPNSKDDERETVLSEEEKIFFDVPEDSNDSLASVPMDVNNDQDVEVATINRDHSYSKPNTKTTLTELANVCLSYDDKDIEEISDTKMNTRQSLKRKADEMIVKDDEIIVKDDEIIVKDDEIIVKDMPVCRKRLLSVLNYKFALNGEVKTADGATIDPRCILKCVADKLLSDSMRQLWAAVRGKKIPFTSRAIDLFDAIQNQCKAAENTYESIFNIKHYHTKQEMIEEYEKRKTYYYYVQSNFKCERCYLGFKYQKRLDYHNKNHEESAGEFACPLCSLRFKRRKGFLRHMRSHQAVYSCKLCPMVTHYKNSMINHYNNHRGKEYRCELCGVVFKSYSGYHNHRSKQHQRGGHVCTLCAREFESQHKLEWHTTRHHTGAVPSPAPAVSCDSCPLSFPSLAVLHKHKHLTHGVLLPYRARVRRGPPARKSIHTCRVCNAKGHSYGWLNLHFRIEHPTVDMDGLYADKKTHLCDICGKGFASSFSLRDHMNMHNNIRPYSCEECPKRFCSGAALALHRMYHAPPAKLCTVCGKKFRTNANLSSHIRTHVGNRCYKCNICGKDFLHQGAVNEHVRGVHHQVRRKKKVASKATRSVKKSVEAD